MKYCTLILLVVFLSCSKKELTIEPIIERFNDDAPHGVQYFVIDNYKHLPDSILMEKILTFSEQELTTKNMTES